MLNQSRELSFSIEKTASAVRRKMAEAGKSLEDPEVMKLCRAAVSEDPALLLSSAEEKAALCKKVFATLRCELEILQEIADDPAVTEIMVNGPENIFVERNSVITRSGLRFESKERLEQVIQRLAARVGREINDLNPIVDARLSDGSRINAVHSNVAVNGPILTIRKFAKTRLTMEQLIAAGDITAEAFALLKLLVEAGYNIFISGGTSSGKTTFLNILSGFIPSHERVIVIEDSAELQIRDHENLVRLETRTSNAQGKGAVTMRDLIRTSLRMRPDRIVVGEVRGAEVIDMLAAMSTGHDGSLSTGHANSPEGMLGRLETMALSGSELPLPAIRSQIAGAIDVIVQLARTSDGHRRVTEICELTGLSEGSYTLNTLFSFDHEKGLARTGAELCRTEKLRLYGGEGAIEKLHAI